MGLKLLPREDSIFTKADAESFFSETQSNSMSLKGSSNLGIDGKKKYRELAVFNSLETDKYITKNNSSACINLTEDAPSGPGTGYSAFGTPASSIDMVCGRMTGLPDVSKNSSVYVNNNFTYDAARFYISETTDLEDNFSMPKGDNIRQKAKSGIGAQADTIALKGRTGIKLTTSQYGERNSKGGKIRSGSGIELIAGTYTDNLQPLVLGNNLEGALTSIMNRINSLSDIVIDLAQVHNQALFLIQSHTHTLGVDPTTGLPGTVPSASLLTGLSFSIADNTTKGIINGTINKLNLLFDEVNYLTSMGYSYINSDLNRTN
tara:strand:+ start:37 stop:993 length:957 start_codon:yes stop_codon:yes gene_type:complete